MKSIGLPRWALPVALLLLALLLLWPDLEPARVLAWLEYSAHQPTTIALLIVTQALLLVFALPGSLVLLLVATTHTPPAAVAILMAGSLPGALGAYLMARRLGSRWRPRRGAWLIDLLARRGDFLTQCALRVLPGCPHWAVNYGCGLLRLPLLPYMLAALIGLSVKWSVYAAAIHAATQAASQGEAIPLDALLPLLLLAILLVLGSLLRQWALRRGPARADGGEGP